MRVERIHVCLVGPRVWVNLHCKISCRSPQQEVCKNVAGSVRDEAEIRGHRRTCWGNAGRIINAINGSSSTLLLDEIDKMSSDYKGDPASWRYWWRTDKEFRDHYLELPMTCRT